MRLRNELVAPGGEAEDDSDRDGGSDETDADAGAENFQQRPRLKSAEEISHAIDQLIVMMSVGIMPTSRARALLQGLKIQLDCTRASKSDSLDAGSGPGLDEAVQFFAENADALRTLAPGLNSQLLEAILAQSKRGA